MSFVSCPERHLDIPGQSAERQPESKSNRETLKQRPLDTASDDELERLLQEQTRRVKDMEILIWEMRSNTNEHATVLLAKLRMGVSVCELVENHMKAT